MTYLKYCPLFYKQKPDARYLSRLMHLNQNTLQAIYTHPFNQELFAGTLPQEKFGLYLRDDFLYLRQFSCALQNIAKRTETTHPGLSKQLNTLANDVINNEHSMQLQYREHFREFYKHQTGTSISQYSQYLVKTSTQAEVPEALCSILPCFWIYYQLGTMMADKDPMKTHPYSDWIATYSGADFVQLTQNLATEVNVIVEDTHPIKQPELIRFFSRSVSFELDFFDEIYYAQNNKKHDIRLVGH